MTTKKRLTLGLSLVAAGSLAAVFSTPAFYSVRGWWRGEPFFHGLPSSYWQKDQQPAARYWAATLLGRLEEKAKTAVPALTLALQDEDHERSPRSPRIPGGD